MPAWAALRALTGASIAGAYMVVESWLNTRSNEHTRGTMLSRYMMTSYIAMGGAQQMLQLADTAGQELFMLAAVMVVLGVIPVAITSATHPAPVESSRFGMRRLWGISPVAVVGCLASGMISGALLGMAPIFAQDVGMSLAGISTFMTVLLASGLLLQVPIGRLSDRFDRRTVIIGVAFTCLVVSALMLAVMQLGAYRMMTMTGPVTMISSTYTPWLFVVAGTFGGISATLYPLSLAYANDYIEPKDMVEASAGLLLAYGVGAALGPLVGAAAMRLVGPEGLFQYIALVAGGMTLFALYRTRKRSWVPVAEKESFVPMADIIASPVPMELDPRTEGTQLELDLVEEGTPAQHRAAPPTRVAE